MIELRSLMVAPEVRAAADGKGQTIQGYAAVFNSPAEIGDMFIEEIAPGAFTETVAQADVLGLYNHDRSALLGRKSSGTLRLREDAKGLFAEIDLPDTTTGRDVAELVRRGDLKGMSFGFNVKREEWDDTGDVPRRRILQVDLGEVSAVPFPAYSDTTLALRSREAARGDAERERARRNQEAAQARIAARKAEQEQRFRGIRPNPSR
ncbi:UNVERIFIED_ORG: HK97 family phage prohead protease [Sphingomonas sp. R1F5B]